GGERRDLRHQLRVRAPPLPARDRLRSRRGRDGRRFEPRGARTCPLHRAARAHGGDAVMMSGSVSTRYASRSLRRNFRRTMLSVFGVAFGVGVGLLAIAFIRGQEAMMADAAAGGGVGHVRIAPAGWNERRADEMRLTEWREVLERARSMDGVAVATPRATVGGLLGLGTRSAHVRLTGVDARTEPRALRYVREVGEGRYLRPGERDAVVLGRAAADRLGAELEDELVATVVDRQGEMQSALLTVVGIVRTGSQAI